MKKILLLLTVIIYGCETRNVSVENTATTINGTDIKIYVIDSCEYIGTFYGTNKDAIAHKGNCIFCRERLKTRI